MPLELMREEMVRQLNERSATKSEVGEYVAVWEDAIKHSGKPLPCPLCFLKRQIRRLKSISEENGVALVRCEHCRESFEYESPEAE